MSEQGSRPTLEELQIQKTQVEIANLKKSWIKNPASWVSILTIVGTLFGLAFQYRSHQVEAQEAQIKLDKANSDLAAVQSQLNQKEPRLKQVLAEIDKATTDLSQLTSEREGVQAQLTDLNAKLKDLEAKASSLSPTADNQNIQASVKSASLAVANLQLKNQASIDRAKAATETLMRVRAGTSGTHQ